MADREWYRERYERGEWVPSEFVDDRDYDRRRYVDRDEDSYERWHSAGPHDQSEPGVSDRMRGWWHRNVSDATLRDDRGYDRDYSHGPISAGHSGWVRNREWESRRGDWDRPAADERYTENDWRTRNYTQTAGSSAFGAPDNYGGGLYSESERDRWTGRYAGRGPKGWRRSDERIREEVNEELTRNPEVDASDVEVAVLNSEITLTGTVDSRYEKREAEECSWRVPGVKDVHNQLRIRQGAGSMIASVFDKDKR
jgi:osmotically-inducible protein OsmY